MTYEYYFVIIIIIISSIDRFMRSKKATLIMFLISPICLFIAYFVSPYMHLRSNYGGTPSAVYFFDRDIGFSG